MTPTQNPRRPEAEDTMTQTPTTEPRDEYETPAPDRLARITAHLDSGRRVLIANPGRPVLVTPRAAARFAAAGQPLFRVRGANLEMARGRRYESLRFSPIVFLED